MFQAADSRFTSRTANSDDRPCSARFCVAESALAGTPSTCAASRRMSETSLLPSTGSLSWVRAWEAIAS